MHAGPNFVASRMPLQAGIATGGFQRAAPVGGSAYGSPLKTSTSPLASPSTIPAGALTVGPLATTGAASTAAALKAIARRSDDISVFLQASCSTRRTESQPIHRMA